MKPTLAFIKQLALGAGDILQTFINKELDIKHKSRTDLVTNADHASERFIIDAIRGAFPNHTINAEESGEWEGEAEHQWYIDPLDGTLNYAHGVPIYCVSMGYAYQGKMALGVVYDPTRDEMFGAERGKGATLNDQPMVVSKHTDIINCMLATGFPNDIWGSPDDNTDNFIRFSQLAQTVRRLGSAALDIAYIAAGRLDGYWTNEVFRWDVAAGTLMVEEAGGLVTSIRGDDEYMRKPVSIVAANPTIHSKMLDVLAEIREKRNHD
ncbi:MAG: inositol monophosphatase family protein [Chloroflexota bacterium]|nr:inositol monophosphatase family protein [Chloroflexota bacterium]